MLDRVLSRLPIWDYVHAAIDAVATRQAIQVSLLQLNQMMVGTIEAPCVVYLLEPVDGSLKLLLCLALPVESFIVGDGCIHLDSLQYDVRLVVVTEAYAPATRISLKLTLRFLEHAEQLVKDGVVRLEHLIVTADQTSPTLLNAIDGLDSYAQSLKSQKIAFEER